LAADLGSRWLERGRPDLAVAEFERAAVLEQRVRPVPGSTGASERGDFYYNYATALARLGHQDQALLWYQRAVAEAPDHADAIRGLADSYLAAGRAAEADSLYDRLSLGVGGEALALEGRGWIAARGGRIADAEQSFTRAVTADPGLFTAWTALIRVQAQAHEIDAAKATLQRARQAGLPRTDQSVYEALLAALSGDRAAATRALAEVPASALQGDPTLADVMQITRRRSRPRARRTGASSGRTSRLRAPDSEPRLCRPSTACHFC
jgi:Tfp pilus assembly protein PilF